MCGVVLEVVGSQRERRTKTHSHACPTRRVQQREPRTPNNGVKVGVVLEFSLPSACYATMCIREALKVSTSTNDMTALNRLAANANTNSSSSDHADANTTANADADTNVAEDAMTDAA